MLTPSYNAETSHVAEQEDEKHVRELYDLVRHAKSEAPDTIVQIVNYLRDLQQTHGLVFCQAIATEVINLCEPYRSTDKAPAKEFKFKKYGFFLAIEAEKLLVAYGAIPYATRYISSVVGPIILEQIQQRKGATFNPTLLPYKPFFVPDDNDPQLQDVLRYFQQVRDLLARPDAANNAINKTFMLVGYHWELIHVQFYKNTAAEPAIKLFFEDNTSKYILDKNSELNCAAPFKTDVARFVAIARQVFQNNMTVYSSNVYLGFDNNNSTMLNCLTFARMIHSMEYGKFKAKYPDGDFFSSLAKMPGKSFELIGGGSGFCIRELPAKLAQMRTHPYYSNITTPYGNKMIEWRNAKPECKFSEMIDRLRKAFAGIDDLQARLKLIDVLMHKYSSKNLPNQAIPDQGPGWAPAKPR